MCTVVSSINVPREFFPIVEDIVKTVDTESPPESANASREYLMKRIFINHSALAKA